jgi:hypothetical protein
MRQKYYKFKNFVQRHKVAIAITGTAASCLYLNGVALRQHDEFLKEKGLYNEFYEIED